MSRQSTGLSFGHCLLPRNRGSVTVELSFVIPVLFLIMFAVGNLGRMAAQLSWMSQVGYQVVLSASEADSAERVAAVEGRWLRILDGYEKSSGGSRAVQSETRAVTVTAGPNALVSVDVQGNADSITGMRGVFPLRVRVVGPVLAPDAAAAGVLSTPANPPAASRRRCDGSLGGTSTSSCFVCANLENCACPTAPLSNSSPCV